MWSLGLLLGGCLALVSDSIADEATWRFAKGRAVITPQEPMWMSGYGGRDQVAQGKLTDLWAKIVLLEDAQGQRAALVTLDLVGIGAELSERLRQQVGQVTEVNPQAVVLNCSHTHTGPVVGHNLAPLHYRQVDADQQQRINRYVDQLVAAVGSAAEQAAGDWQPGELAWASGTCDVAVNRRNNPEGEVPQLRAAGSLAGPFDHDVPTLVIRDAAGTVQVILFGYACHATVLSFYEWSGDYPGFAQIALEERFPEAQAMFWAGCGGDQNPLPRREVVLARHYGERLALAVERVVRTQTLEPIASRLETQWVSISLPLDRLPTRDELERELSSQDRFVRARAEQLLEGWEATGDLIREYPYPIATWRLGDQVEWVFLGGEVVVDYALRLKSEHRRQATWVAGYSNDVMAYIPSRRVLREGGYEGVGAMVYYGLPGAWDPSVESRIVEEVARQLAGNHDKP